MIVQASSEVGIGPCITVVLDAGYEAVQAERLVNSIGSANYGTGGVAVVRCSLSTHNFKKIKSLFPGARLSHDDTTRKMVHELQEKNRKYMTESMLGSQVKLGNTPPVPDYTFKKPPYEHQVIGWQFLHALSTPALFGDCGVGKTYIAGTWADSLLKQEPFVFLVICPVNIIQHVWMADVAKFTDMVPVRLHEPSSYKRKEKRAVRFATDGDIYIINPELAIRSEKEIRELIRRHRKNGRKLGLIIDESSKIKSSNSKIYKVCREIRSYASRCVIMTGTPSPNGVGDLWAQFAILDLGMTLQPKYGDYRHDTHNSFQMKGVNYTVGHGQNAKKIPVTHWRPKAGIASHVYDWIEPRMIRFRAEDCIDLPDKSFIRRSVPMTTEQEKIYKEMADHLYTEFEGEGVTARVAVARLMKLREITGGFIITDKPKRLVKPIGKDAPKMLELDLLLDQLVGKRLGDDRRNPTKAIIWAQYQWECQTLNNRYKRYGSRGLYGGISSGAKDENIHAFMNDDDCQILVCHPASAGHGLTLTAANYSFYYSLGYNYDEFYQSARRIARPGQERPMFFYFLIAPNSIDELIVRALEGKKNVQDIITDGPFKAKELESLMGSQDQQLAISI